MDFSLFLALFDALFSYINKNWMVTNTNVRVVLVASIDIFFVASNVESRSVHSKNALSSVELHPAENVLISIWKSIMFDTLALYYMNWKKKPNYFSKQQQFYKKLIKWICKIATFSQFSVYLDIQ